MRFFRNLFTRRPSKSLPTITDAWDAVQTGPLTVYRRDIHHLIGVDPNEVGHAVHITNNNVGTYYTCSKGLPDCIETLRILVHHRDKEGEIFAKFINGRPNFWRYHNRRQDVRRATGSRGVLLGKILEASRKPVYTN